MHARSSRSRVALGVAVGLAIAGVPVPGRAGPANEPAAPVDEERGPIQIESAASDPLTELELPPTAANLHARQLAQTGRHLEAARLHESLWASARPADPRHLYHAGLARAQAGQHARALRAFFAYLQAAPTLSPAAREHVAARYAAARAQTVAVRLRVVEAVHGGTQELTAEDFVGARITVEAAGDPGDMFVATGSEVQVLTLDPGAYMVRLEVPGYLPVAGPQQVEGGVAGRQWDLTAVRRQVVVDLRFSPERALRGARMKLYPADRPPSPQIDRRIEGPTATVQLTTGTWQLEVEARRHQARVGLVIAAQQGPIEVVLQPRGAGDWPRFERDRKLFAGVLGSFVGLYGVGVGLVIAGARREDAAEQRNAATLMAAGIDPEAKLERVDPSTLAAVEAAYPTRQYHDQLARASNLGLAGAVVSFSGLGAALSVIPVGTRSRHRAAYVGMGIGGGLVAGGAAWMYSYQQRRAGLLGASETAERVRESENGRGVGERLGSALLAGVGLGLVVFSAVTLVVDVAKKRGGGRSARVGPMLGAGRAGVAVVGRF